MKTLKSTLLSSLLAALASAQAHATVIVTYAEQPGQMDSTFIHATTDTFDDMATGLHDTANWVDSKTGEIVGKFTSLNVKSADQYGGANNTNYAVTGLGINTQTILNLTNASSYFGLWWSAGDPKNVLDFYSQADGKGTLIAEFTTANLLKKLQPIKTYPDGYYGNPNTGTNYQKDAAEAFAYINFFGVPGTEWSSIVITNNGTSGFEADNYASRVKYYDPTNDGPMPGVVFEAINGTQVVLVPEPSATLAMVLLGGLSLGGPLFQRFKKKS